MIPGSRQSKGGGWEAWAWGEASKTMLTVWGAPAPSPGGYPSQTGPVSQAAEHTVGLHQWGGCQR